MGKFFAGSLMLMFILTTIEQYYTGNAVNLYNIYGLLSSIGIFVLIMTDEILKKLDKKNK